MKTRWLGASLLVVAGLTLLASISWLGGLPAIALSPGTTTRVSVASDGTQGNGGSGGSAISGDGRYVAFRSEASNLVSGDTNGHVDAFVHDRQTGQTTRVSVASDRTQGNFDSWWPAISGDGRYVAFASFATNLVGGDTNGTYDVFVHDCQTGQTTRVSVASDGTQGNYGSLDPAISGDGRYVAFQSRADNLVSGDTNLETDVFVHDRQTGQTTLVSVASDGTQGNGGSIPAISGDGRYVVFQSYADNLVSGDTNDFDDVFVHDRQTGQTTRVSVASDGTQGSSYSGGSTAISGDGRYVAFLSCASNLVSGDTNGWQDVFVHDQQSGQTTRVSVASDGTQGNDHSDYPTISGDGRYVAFQSYADNLVSGDTNGRVDAFVHDRQTGQTTRVSVASDGTQGNDHSDYPTISGDGRYVAFGSEASNLVGGDTNGRWDVFVHDRGALPPPTAGISGQVTDSSGTPLDGILAQAYQHSGGLWNYAGWTTTDTSGNYAIQGLPAGTYRVQFVDLSWMYRSEYYDDKADLTGADDVTVAADTVTPNIDASLDAFPPPPQVEGDVSFGFDATGDLTIVGWRGASGQLTVTVVVTCPVPATPSNVRLAIGTESFPMTSIGNDQYQVTLTLPDDLPPGDGPFDISVSYECNGSPATDPIGQFVWYDPSGQVTDANMGVPVKGSRVSLYRVPGASPDSGTAQDGDCRTVNSRPASSGGSFGAWSGLSPVAIDAGAWVNPELGLINGTAEISPTVNPLVTGNDGRYGWDVVKGCWYVVVEAEGYLKTVSPLVGVPPAVTDLDVALSPPAVYLPILLKGYAP